MSDNIFKWTFTFVLLSVLFIVGITSVHKRGYLGTNDSSNRPAWDSNATLPDDLVRRVLVAEFNGLLDLDDTVISPSYSSGDFNGDGVLDLAAAVRVNMEISAADTSRPPFRFEKVIGPGLSEKPVTPIELTTGILKWYQDHHASILAIVHGSEEYGLRSTKPEQRFVLVDGDGPAAS